MRKAELIDAIENEMGLSSKHRAAMNRPILHRIDGTDVFV